LVYKPITMRSISIFLVALFFYSFHAEAQYKVVNYTNVNKINHLLEDGDFIWVCSSGGVYKRRKSNGTVVMHYNTLNSGLKKDDVKCVYKDNFNNYWLSYSRGGISRFDGVNWTFFEFLNVPGPYFPSNVPVIKSDLLGNLLFATNEGVVKFNGQDWTLLKDGLQKTSAESIVVDDYGNIWYSSRTSEFPLCKIDKEGKLKTFVPPDHDSNDFIQTMEKDMEGILWISFWQKGLMTFDPSNEQWNDYSNEINVRAVTSISLDNSGNIWFGSIEGTGTVCKYSFDSGSKVYFSALAFENYYDKYVNSLLCDVSGKVWVGSWNGLARINFETGKWTLPYRLNSLPSEYIYCTALDSKGNAYMFGLVYSMIELKENTYWNTYNNYNGYPKHIIIDENDNKWAPYIRFESSKCTLTLNKFDSENNLSFYKLSDEIPSSTEIYGIIKDKYKKLIWVASEIGLSWFNPENLNFGTFTTLNSEISGNKIFKITGDSSSLFFRTADIWEKYDLKTGVFSDISFGEGFPPYTAIYDIKIDSDENMWVLTDSYVVKLNSAGIIYWDKPNIPLYDILPANNNKIWLHSGNSLLLSSAKEILKFLIVKMVCLTKFPTYILIVQIMFGLVQVGLVYPDLCQFLQKPILILLSPAFPMKLHSPILQQIQINLRSTAGTLVIRVR
jgi:ligand-binding sensor domain-containing protein